MANVLMQNGSEVAFKKVRVLSLALILGMFALVVIRRAWICDDAYITFRTVDNFINGYRLTWNITERVQAYTHPLWMFLLSLFYFFTREIYFTSLGLSIVVSLLTLYLMARYLAVSWVSAIFGIFVLMLSKAFVDFSTLAICSL
jgi:arabinofuranosyltransferase